MLTPDLGKEKVMFQQKSVKIILVLLLWVLGILGVPMSKNVGVNDH